MTFTSNVDATPATGLQGLPRPPPQVALGRPSGAADRLLCLTCCSDPGIIPRRQLILAAGYLGATVGSCRADAKDSLRRSLRRSQIYLLYRYTWNYLDILSTLLSTLLSTVLSTLLSTPLSTLLSTLPSRFHRFSKNIISRYLCHMINDMQCSFKIVHCLIRYVWWCRFFAAALPCQGWTESSKNF